MKKAAVLVVICLMLAVIPAGCGKSEKIITQLDDASEAKIGVMTGSTGEQSARAMFPGADIKSFDDVMDAVAALKAGQLEAVVMDNTEASNVVRHNPDLWFLPEPVLDEDIAIGIRKGNEELLAAVDRIIAGLISDGTLEDMWKRWFKQDSSPYELVELSVPAGGTPLRVGVSATREPFCFIDENRGITGFDGELARRIAIELGRPVEFFDMKFAALIPALQSGKIDLAFTMTITEERKKSIYFSQPVFASAQVLLVKKAPGAIGGGKNVSFLARISESFYNNLILENRYLLIVDGLKVTVIISLLATIFGTLLGTVICAMRMSRNKILQQPARVYISILRGTPVLVLLMFIFYVVFASVNINPILVAVVAFGMNFAAYVSEMFRAGIESVDKGQIEAGIAMGFTKAKTFLYIVLPQAIRHIFPVYKGEFISLVKMTSVVGYIAVQDLTKASDIIRSRTFDAFFPLFMVAVLYFLISWLLTLSLGYVEWVTDPKAKRKQA
ncbi:MAG TPA: ABC transporter substrate-binding protein/permease [Bacillota bacterium]|nr:ABC transporter substrate-binding protein/permease [Peptococcaceae bacterium MAG4]NLW37197.1 ABC transporter substrate-binding protein/permease [Peptococcaceae bacterium]HPZ43695.1 ABC transporter substrate-binding protein/permease [Bacillota bacterium]HUM58557.1 ABC transporter substrate-binding protein/permease [Bacillota bacterium]